MKVKELIEKLSMMDPDRLVVLSRDEEGNEFMPVRQIDGEVCFYEGEVFILELTQCLRAKGYEEDDVAPKGAVPCVVLWP